ncbi:MAG: fibronectin type III domain-containing protein, partial [Bacillota bacterium]
AAPTNLAAAAASDTQVDLTWADNSSNETGFAIEWSTSPTFAAAQRQTVAAGQTSCSVTGLSPETTYYFRLYAYNAAGGSAVTTASAITGPAAPTGLAADVYTNVTRVDLTWVNNSNNATGFIIERQRNGESPVRISVSGTTTLSYSDVGLDPSTMYTYRVFATNSYGESASSNSVTIATTDFAAYHQTYFTNEPDLTPYGIGDAIGQYSGFFWTGTGYDWSAPNEAGTRAVARQVAAQGGILYIDDGFWIPECAGDYAFDIRTSDPATVQSTITVWSQVIDWIKSECPNLKVGFYGVFPIRDYWTPANYWAAVANPNDPWYQSHFADFEAKYQDWQAANDVLAPLAAKADLIFPSLYAFYDNSTTWQYYAQGMIAEAAQYGKPVVPFINMNLHPSTNPGVIIGGDFWQVQLDTCRQLADGLVIWGGVDYSVNPAQPYAWNDTAPWWERTEAFVLAH